MTLTSFQTFAELQEDKLIYKIGYELGFEDGAKKIVECINSNSDKENISLCVEALTKKENQESSVFPSQKKLRLYNE